MSPRRRSTPPGPTAPDLLAAELREQILRGELAAEHPLREEELAQSFELSRHTVRAALARLADERLLAFEPYRGARVRRFDEAAAVALQELRGALEAEAIRLLNAEHGDVWPDSVRAPILDAIDQLGATEQSGDWLSVTKAHSAVHLAIVASAGASRITEAYRLLDSETLLLLTQLRLLYPSGSLESSHRDYFEAIQRGDTEAVRAHLAHTTELVRVNLAEAERTTSAPERS